MELFHEMLILRLSEFEIAESTFFVDVAVPIAKLNVQMRKVVVEIRDVVA
jgi:hypothetical protein